MAASIASAELRVWEKGHWTVVATYPSLSTVTLEQLLKDLDNNGKTKPTSNFRIAVSGDFIHSQSSVFIYDGKAKE